MLMNLSDKKYFSFTQQSLSTFNKCPLKFIKRYCEGLKWDSYPEEAIKNRVEGGKDFHLLAQRYFLGIDFGLQENKEEHRELKNWLRSLKNKFPLVPEYRYLPEYKFIMSSSGINLEANFDLLIIKNNEIQIWDWKTHGGSLKKSNNLRKQLLESYQTKVYLFMLKENAKIVLDKEIPSENISMHYWQPDPEGVVADIKYSDELHENFREIIKSKISAILEYDYSMFNKELFRKHCEFCEFNWLCNNGALDFTAIGENDETIDELDYSEK